MVVEARLEGPHQHTVAQALRIHPEQRPEQRFLPACLQNGRRHALVTRAGPPRPLPALVHHHFSADALALDDHHARVMQHEMIDLCHFALVLEPEVVEDEHAGVVLERSAKVEGHGLLGGKTGGVARIRPAVGIGHLGDHVRVIGGNPTCLE